MVGGHSFGGSLLHPTGGEHAHSCVALWCEDWVSLFIPAGEPPEDRAGAPMWTNIHASPTKPNPHVDARSRFSRETQSSHHDASDALWLPEGVDIASASAEDRRRSSPDPLILGAPNQLALPRR